MNSKIIVIAGPTASGKSDFAQELALQQDGEIINADSQQFYRGFDIGTGKIPLEKRQVRHWLFDICEPGSFITAMDFASQADGIIQNILAEKKVPIVVGGTGLYLRALLEGFDPLPSRNAKIREELQSEYDREGGTQLYERLQQVDPVSAEKIGPTDPSRLIRYLEIYLLSGQAPSSLLKHKRASQLRYLTHTFWLKPPREILREKIAKRVHNMMTEGWVEEVRSLMQQGHDPRNLTNKPIGYTELTAVLDGQDALAQAEAKIITKTQQYAKRQETFFRGLFASAAYRTNGCEMIEKTGHFS